MKNFLTRIALPSATMRYLPIRLPGLMACLATALPHTAHAFALGGVISQSAVGQPLRVEIRLIGEDFARASECLHVISGPGTSADGIPGVQGKISVDRSNGDPVVVVSHREKVPHPVIRLSLDDSCSSLSREFVLLLSEPPAVSIPKTESIAPSPGSHRPTSKSSSTSPKPGLITGPGDSLANTARRQADNGQKARSPAQAPRKNVQGKTAKPKHTPTPPRPASTTPKQSPKDRLEVQGASTPDAALTLAPKLAAPPRGPAGEQERDLLRREQQLQETSDRQLLEQVELAQRLRRLEALQAELRIKAQRLDAPPAASPQSAAPPLPKDKPGPSSAALFALAGLLLVMGAAVFHMLRKGKPPHGQVLADGPKEHIPGSGRISPPEETQPFSQATPPEPEYVATPPKEDLVWEAYPAAGSTTPHAAPRLPEEDMLAEHDSVIELAEIMLSFGRVHGAAEALAEFIKAHPTQSVAPWLKLLEVYRTADMRGEFEDLIAKLHANFNVETITWDNFDAAVRHPTSSLEDFPHIMEPIQRLWASPECLSLLESLVRDNRNGQRGGFQVGVVDELLVLTGIMNYRLAVGQGNPKAA